MSVGNIEIIHGCMFAGKTTELIKNYQYYKMLNKNILVINSNKDTRSEKGSLCTHTNKTVPCITISKLLPLIDTKDYLESNVIMIEEAQFFDNELIEFVMSSSEKYNKKVIVAGLILDCYRKKFGYILDLIPLADKVTHLKAICTECNKIGKESEAIFTKRLVNSSEQTLIGGSDKYTAVCRMHFVTDEVKSCVKADKKTSNINNNYDKYFIWGGYNYM